MMKKEMKYDFFLYILDFRRDIFQIYLLYQIWI